MYLTDIQIDFYAIHFFNVGNFRLARPRIKLGPLESDGVGG